MDDWVRRVVVTVGGLDQETTKHERLLVAGGVATIHHCLYHLIKHKIQFCNILKESKVRSRKGRKRGGGGEKGRERSENRSRISFGWSG